VIKQKSQLKKVCENLLKRLSQPVLVEEFLPGREFTVGILGNGDDAYVLGAMEETMAEPSMPLVYSFVVKEECEKLIKYLPLQKGKLFKLVAELALQSYKVLQCRDAGRVDIRCDDKGLPHFLEVNPLPGLHPTHSDLPMIATQEGTSYNDLIGSIINNALKRLKK